MNIKLFSRKKREKEHQRHIEELNATIEADEQKEQAELLKEQQEAQKLYRIAAHRIAERGLPPVIVPRCANLQQHKKLRAQLECEQFEKAVQQELPKVSCVMGVIEATQNFITGNYPLVVNLDEAMKQKRREKNAATGNSAPVSSDKKESAQEVPYSYIKEDEQGFPFNSKYPPNYEQNGSMYHGYSNNTEETFFYDFAVQRYDLRFRYKDRDYYFLSDQNSASQCDENFNLVLQTFLDGNDVLEKFKIHGTPLIDLLPFITDCEVV